jgi:hypothetical protein
MAQFTTRFNRLLKNNDELYEVVMIGGQAGPSVYVNTGNLNVSSDAFGRARVSSPLTLFDSSHRFADNDLFHEDTTGGGSSSFVQDEGLIDMDVGTASGDEVLRETKKVFSYQPGKSLLIMNTYKMAPAQENLRQRVGYFGDKNGIYIEQDGLDHYLVERSSVSGSTVNTRVAQADWGVDVLDGTGPSGVTLDHTKAQIMWIDIEWLGLGSVRTGFVINGQLICCHIFHHANLVESTYITTASLPVRYEITNTGSTDAASKLKQICSSVLSEGGYELRGRQQAVQIPITTPRDLTVSATRYPVISIRLKTSPDRLDAIVIPTAMSVLGVGNNGFFNWQAVAGATTTGGTWTSAGANSAVEYNLTGTSTSGGRVLASGFISSTNQGNSPIDILKEALFKFQLERNTFTSTAEEFTLVVASKNSGDDVYAAVDWEEITR